MNAAPAFRGGIIAAGDGTRLRAGGWEGSKAMLPVGGRALIDHALDRFAAAGIELVAVIVNEASADCRRHIEARRTAPEVDLIVRTTPSSFASFAFLAERLAGERAMITTVDSVMPAGAFRAFVAEAGGLPADAIGLGVTAHVDDEAPLWAELDPSDNRIVRLGGAPAAHVTAGLYVLPAEHRLPSSASFARLRDYLAWLVGQGRPVIGIVLPQVFDVDRPEDVAMAETALESWAQAGPEEIS